MHSKGPRRVDLALPRVVTIDDRCSGMRVESIYSKQSEEPKAACQRKPTAPLALSSSEQLDKGGFARFPTALRPSRPVQHRVFHQAEKQIDTSSGPAIGLSS